MYRTEKAFIGVVVLALAATAAVFAVPQVRTQASQAAVKYGVLPPANQKQRKLAGDVRPTDGRGGRSISETIQAGRKVVKGVPGKQVYTGVSAGDPNGPWPGTQLPAKGSTIPGSSVDTIPLTQIDASFAATMQAETTAAVAMIAAETKSQKTLCKGPCAAVQSYSLTTTPTAAPTGSGLANASPTTSATQSDPTGSGADTSADTSADNSSSVNAGG